MSAIKKACKAPRCPSLHTGPGRYCPEHTPAVSESFSRKNQERLSFYGSERWKKLRRMKLNRDPLCEVCMRTEAVAVHHKLDARTYPQLRFDYENLQSICLSCHAKESQKESRK